MPAKLSVNLNAIAMLRNRRDLPWPSVTGLGRIALAAGAHGLTVHPRPDQRHTRYSDLPELRALIDDEFPAAEFNIEGYPTEDFLRLVEENQPNQVTLVPDDPAQPTSDHGWNFAGGRAVPDACCQEAETRWFPRVALFRSRSAGCGCGARNRGRPNRTLHGPLRLQPFQSGTGGQRARKAPENRRCGLASGLGVNAGHDLTVANLPALARRIPRLAEVSIGHGLTADALEYGMAGTIGRFLKACGW